MDEDLGLQDLVKIILVHEIEVRHNSVWVCKTIKKDKKISLAKCKSKEIFWYKQKLKKKKRGITVRL